MSYAEAISQDAAIGLRITETAGGFTQFGGHPNLAEGVDWPHDSAGRPMHHLLQLDCSALPRIDPDFPRSGTISFFITGSYDETSAPDLSASEPGSFAVLYHETNASQAPPRPHPDTCPALGENSFAVEPVHFAKPSEKMGLLRRLLNTQPKPYSKSGGTGYFERVPLDAVVFDSFPTSDPSAVFDAFGLVEDDPAIEGGLRPLQVLGYAPRFDDLAAALSEGFRTCSDEKALAAYEKALDHADVLLLQIVHDPALNLDLIQKKYALQFRIGRADLRARAFGRTKVDFAQIGHDGLWWPSPTPPAAYRPDDDELVAEIALKQLTPFETPTAPGNYFGGAPRLPADLDWPYTRDGHPLSFLMQVDCASLPRAATLGRQELALPPFPASGTVFLFAFDFLDEVNDDTFQILYTPRDVTDIPPRTLPDALKDVPEHLEYNIRVRAEDGAAARPEGERPFEPVAFVTIAPPGYGDPDLMGKQSYRSDYGGALPHEEDAVPYVTLIMDWLPNYWKTCFRDGAYPYHGYKTAPIRKIPQSYPWRWGDIGDALVFFPHDSHDFVAPEDRATIFGAELVAEGEAWKAKAATYDALDRIPEADREAYRTWLRKMDASAANIPSESAGESNAAHRKRMEAERAFIGIMERLAQPYPNTGYGSLPTTLHHLAFDQGADDLPEEMRAVVAELVRFHRSDTQLRGNDTVHHPDPDLMFATPSPHRHKEGKVLLFSLASGSGLPINWADCHRVEVWIGPEDLAAGRFDCASPDLSL